MKKQIPQTARRFMVAVVVGAALTSLSAPENLVAAQPSPQAVQDISRYCHVCWRNARLHPDHWQDCTQEVLTRLLERVEPGRWSTLLREETEDRREFLRAIDAVKKRAQRTKKYAGLVDEVSDHRYQPEASRNELREVLDRAAQEVLSQRQERIVQLSCAGWAIPEIADELGTTVERISDEKYKAIRKLRKHLEV
jgi:RNA polymerase sigma factor (sigma-70 family)